MSENLARSQERLLYMAKVITEILSSHDIPHSIIYGTLLGAVRHGGFIPWDDDFDFCIFEERYDEAVDILRKELPQDLFVEDEETEPLYFHSWAHVKDLKTEACNKEFAQDNAYSHKGLAIDLYRMKKMRFCDMYEASQEQLRIYITRRRELGLMSDEEYKWRINQSVDIRKDWYERIVKDEKKNSRDPQRDIYSNIYTSLYIHEIDDFFPLRKFKFENMEFWGPNNAEKMLRDWYGNYMILPPEDKRLSHFDEVKFL